MTDAASSFDKIAEDIDRLLTILGKLHDAYATEDVNDPEAEKVIAVARIVANTGKGIHELGKAIQRYDAIKNW